ncbi:histidine phosphatase family protein [Roseburia intestinalis]|nr:histidine phosphatase family protein [Roseburia intestinalis]
MNLYVVRHGETDMGKNHIIANETEPLNANGIRQAQNLQFHHQQKGMRGKKRRQY